MSALTIRLPDDKYERLKALSRRRGTSVNRLIDEVATLLLAEFDDESRFATRAERQPQGGDHAARSLRGSGIARTLSDGFVLQLPVAHG